MSTTRTVAIICFGEPGSAIGRFAASAARLLAAAGHSVFVFTRHALKVDAPNVVVKVIESEFDQDLIGNVREFTLGVNAAFATAISPALENVVLVGCEWSAIPALQIISALRKVPFVLCFETLERQRSDMISAQSNQIEEFEIQGIQQAKSVLVLGEKTAETARSIAKLEGADAQKINALIETFPVQNFQKPLDPGAVKARYLVGPVDPTILFVGPLDEDHGPDLLMKAIPLILKKHPQARFIFVGEGTLFWMLRIYTRYLNLDHAVRIAGHLEGEKLFELVQGSDIIIAPERKSGVNWPILSGWSAGKAVVATHEAAQGMIEHEKNGVLIYPLPDSCAWGVCRVLGDSKLWSDLVENGKAKIAAEFGEKMLAWQLGKAVSEM